MNIILLSALGLVFSLLAIRLFIQKSGIVIPRKIPFDLGIILTHSAMVTCLVAPAILWSIAAWMLTQAFWQETHGLTVQTPAIALLGACWCPAIFCLGILSGFFIVDSLHRRFGQG